MEVENSVYLGVVFGLTDHFSFFAFAYLLLKFAHNTHYLKMSENFSTMSIIYIIKIVYIYF